MTLPKSKFGIAGAGIYAGLAIFASWNIANCSTFMCGLDILYVLFPSGFGVIALFQFLDLFFVFPGPAANVFPEQPAVLIPTILLNGALVYWICSKMEKFIDRNSKRPQED